MRLAWKSSASVYCIKRCIVIGQLLVRLSIALLLAAVTPAKSANYNEWWWEPARSGNGFNVGHQGNTLFIAGFLYDVYSEPTWVVITATLSNKVATGEVRAYRGPYFGGPFGATPVTSAPVGTAMMTFMNEELAQLQFTIDGKSLSYQLVRFNIAAIPLAGVFSGHRFGGPSCAGETFADNKVDVIVSESGESLTVDIRDFFDGLCRFTGKKTQSGNGFIANGLVRCEKNFDEGNWALSSIRKIDDGLFTARMNVSLTNRSCTYSRTYVWSGN